MVKNRGKKKHKSKGIKPASLCSYAILEAWRPREKKELKREKNKNSRILYLAELPFTYQSKIKLFKDKQELRKYFTQVFWGKYLGDGGRNINETTSDPEGLSKWGKLKSRENYSKEKII